MIRRWRIQLTQRGTQSTEKESFQIGQLVTAQFENLTSDLFLGIGFTHHILLINKCKAWAERLFYMQKTAENHWTVEMLEWQIKTQLYQKQGKTIQNNFGKTLPVALQQSSTLAFKDEYLLDYINLGRQRGWNWRRTCGWKRHCQQHKGVHPHRRPECEWVRGFRSLVINIGL